MNRLSKSIIAPLFAIIFIGMGQNLSAQVAKQDSLALVALYDSTNGANWTNHNNWLTGPVSTWYGITVEDNRVFRIILNMNNLTGHIPPQIGNLENLRQLLLSSNAISGPIPPEIGNLVNLLSLGLSVNSLSGGIPVEIGNLTKLTSLMLNQNKLTGTIPTALFHLTDLNILTLNLNQLSGQIPQAIGNLTKLETLSFYSNQLDGILPEEMQNLSQLTSLYLAYNRFSGAIPAWIGSLANLDHLVINNNQFVGQIPPEIGNLINLSYLNFSFNQLSGTIPTEIGGMVQLQELHLNHNQLDGTIPAEISNCRNLTAFCIAENQFIGVVPIGFAYASKLKQVHLHYNRLLDLPDLSADTSLVDLKIHNNRFTFEDIEPNLFVASFTYSPQDSLGASQDTVIVASSELTLSVSVDGTANRYQWTKDGAEIANADASTYTIAAATLADQGSYLCKITNTLATELTLYSRPIRVSVTGGTSIAELPTATPKVYDLCQNYPNPFNPSTLIQYQLPIAAQVNLRIFSVNGQEIISLVDEWQSAGSHLVLWDGVDARGQRAASGVYLYKIVAGHSFSAVKKMILVR